MSSGFISGGTTDAPIERDDEWVQAQREIEATRRRKEEEENRQAGGKTLYETLQANKAAKQEAFEESIRLKNQFRSLDEDEVEFLDAVLESTRTKEAEIRRETTEQLDLFRRQQEEADKALLVEGADGNGSGGGVGAESVEGEQWVVSGKKRRRGKEKPVLKGVKLRKTFSAGDDRATRPDEHGMPASPTPEVATKNSGVISRNQGSEKTNCATTKSIADAGSAESATMPTSPTNDATVPVNKSGAVLGLGNYSSDDDE